MRIDPPAAEAARLRLAPDAGPGALDAALTAPELDIDFPAFTDGRGFSIAAQLRERGYAGELRAVGDLLPDQAGALRRAGFDAVAPAKTGREEAWRAAAAWFNTAYQPAADAAAPAYLRRARAVRRARAEALAEELDGADAATIIETALAYAPGRAAVLSSFGAEAAATLALVADADRHTPVLFLETGRHFAQTLSYRQDLEARLGLTHVAALKPDAAEAADEDGDDRLWARDPDACCGLRKVRPLARALPAYDVLITGRKRAHGGERTALPVVEFDGERLRFNPLADWSQDRVAAFLSDRDLPRHPLVAQGFPSIGCWPCTAPVNDGASLREGRWAGLAKDECGIHDASRIARAAGSRRLL